MKNLKIAVKLLLGFGLITIVLVGLSVREYSMLNRLEEERQDLVESMMLSDDFMEAKYNIKSCEQLLMEIINSENTAELQEDWALTQEQIDEFDANVNSFKESAMDETWGVEYASKKSEIINLAETLDKKHNDVFTPTIKKIYDLKTKIFSDAQMINADIEQLHSIENE